jgi:hypothetical protein
MNVSLDLGYFLMLNLTTLLSTLFSLVFIVNCFIAFNSAPHPYFLSNVRNFGARDIMAIHYKF